MKSIFAKAGCFLLATTFLTAPVFSEASLAKDVTLGALMPLTGGLQSYGKSSLNGVRMAVEEVNRAGGIRGNHVRLKVGDTQTKAQPAIDAAKKLVDLEGAQALVGALGSGVTIPVATTVAVPSSVPMISGASSAPAITTLKDNDFIFRTAPSDAYQGVALARVVKQRGIGKVAVIFVNNDYGIGLAESFARDFKKNGGTVTGQLAYEPNKASYRGELSRLARGGAEHLLVIAYPDNGGMTIVKQSLEEGLFGKFIFTDGMKSPDFVKQLGGRYLEGSFGTVPQAAATGASGVFKQAYRKKFGELPPKPFIDGAYDAAMILMLAMEKAGTADRSKLPAAIRAVATAPGVKVSVGDFAKARKLLAAGKEIDYDGAAGPHEFDQNGDVPGTLALWEIRSGKITDKGLLSSR